MLCSTQTRERDEHDDQTDADNQRGATRRVSTRSRSTSLRGGGGGVGVHCAVVAVVAVAVVWRHWHRAA